MKRHKKRKRVEGAIEESGREYEGTFGVGPRTLGSRHGTAAYRTIVEGVGAAARGGYQHINRPGGRRNSNTQRKGLGCLLQRHNSSTMENTEKKVLAGESGSGFAFTPPLQSRGERYQVAAATPNAAQHI